MVVGGKIAKITPPVHTRRRQGHKQSGKRTTGRHASTRLLANRESTRVPRRTIERREHCEEGGPSLVDGSWWRHPFRGLTGDRRYPIEVTVVVQHHEPRTFGGGGDEQIAELHRAM